MPLVISGKAKKTFYLPNEECLCETLGHSDFDGQDWAVGDRIVWEDGTSALVERYQSEEFFGWSEPAPAALPEILALIWGYGDSRLPPESDVPSFDRLFYLLSQPPERKNWLARLLGGG